MQTLLNVAFHFVNRNKSNNLDYALSTCLRKCTKICRLTSIKAKISTVFPLSSGLIMLSQTEVKLICSDSSY